MKARLFSQRDTFELQISPIAVSCPTKMLRVAKSSSQALYVVGPVCGSGNFHVYSSLSHLRYNLDQVVKVSPPPRADDALDVVWEAGVVCLVVNILNLEELVADKSTKTKGGSGSLTYDQKQKDPESPVPAKV